MTPTKLTHWGRVTHICVSKLTTIGSDNDLSPGRRQAIICTNAEILLFGPLGTNLSEIIIEIYTFSLTKLHVKMSSGKWRPSCPGLNVLIFVSKMHQIDKWRRMFSSFLWKYLHRTWVRPSTATMCMWLLHCDDVMLAWLWLWYCINEMIYIHRKTSNTRLTLVGNKIVDHSDVVGASPVGAAPPTSSFST